MDGYSLNLVMMSEYETKIWLLENLDLYFTNLENIAIAIAISTNQADFREEWKLNFIVSFHFDTSFAYDWTEIVKPRLKP